MYPWHICLPPVQRINCLTHNKDISQIKKILAVFNGMSISYFYRLPQINSADMGLCICRAILTKQNGDLCKYNKQCEKSGRIKVRKYYKERF